MSGVNDRRRIECKKSKDHGHYPEDEECPYCPPAVKYDGTDTDAYLSQWYSGMYK